LIEENSLEIFNLYVFIKCFYKKINPFIHKGYPNSKGTDSHQTDMDTCMALGAEHPSRDGTFCSWLSHLEVDSR